MFVNQLSLSRDCLNKELNLCSLQVEVLLQRGADINFKDKLGRSALHLAAGRGWTDVIRLLWSKAADIDEETEDSMTPLHLAALNGHTDVASFLLSKNALLIPEDKEENTPLHAAARQGHSQLVEMLLSQGANPWQKNKLGLTPGGSALLGGHPKTADILTTTGWNAQERLHQGYTLLHLTAALGRPQSVRWLLSYGSINVDDADNPYRLSPLHCAVLGKDFRCVNLLVDAGADKEARDYEGHVPYQLLPSGIDERVKEEIVRIIELETSTPGRLDLSAKEAATRPSSTTTESLYATFQALSAEDQVRRVRMWLNASFNNDELENIVKDFPGRGEMLRGIQLARSSRSALETLKAIISLRHDEDFQNDMADTSVRQAVELLTKDPSKYDALVQHDHRIASVVGRMRVVHAAVKSLGGSFHLGNVTVPPSNLEEQKMKDADALRSLTEQLDSAVDAIVAAACASNASQAADAIQLALVRKQEGTSLSAGCNAKAGTAATELVDKRKFLSEQAYKLILALSALFALLFAIYYNKYLN